MILQLGGCRHGKNRLCGEGIDILKNRFRAVHKASISFPKSWQVTGIIYLCASKNPEAVILYNEHDSYEWLDNDLESLEKINRLFE